VRNATLAVLVCMLAPVSVAGQDSLLLRRESPPGTIVRTQFRTVTTVWAFDGRRFESADEGVMRSVSLADAGGRQVAHLTYESVASRTRGSDGRWREFEVLGADSAWVQVSMDERMRVRGANYGTRLPGVTGLLRVLTGIPNLELPDEPLGPGDGWSSTTVASAVPGLRNETVPPIVSGMAHLVLDSIVIRSRDTLGYVTVTGRFPATTFVDEFGPGRVVLSGDLAGSLIWSTSWNGFVSGVSRTRMTMEREGGQEGEPEGGGNELKTESTTSYQVKP
jgi:hypothetical protein